MAAQEAGRSRRLSALTRAGRVTLSHFGRVFHLLWLEVTGFFFLALAIIGGAALFEQYPKYEAGKVSGMRLVLAACFMLLFAYFGITSFLRTRKKS